MKKLISAQVSAQKAIALLNEVRTQGMTPATKLAIQLAVASMKTSEEYMSQARKQITSIN